MLILTRKIGESIRIGDAISIKVVELDNRHVKLGIEAPRKLISVKKSKSGSPLPVVVPEISRLKNKYSFSWGFNNDDMNNVVAVIQKYFDQGISVNHYYDKKKYAD